MRSIVDAGAVEGPLPPNTVEDFPSAELAPHVHAPKLCTTCLADKSKATMHCSVSAVQCSAEWHPCMRPTCHTHILLIISRIAFVLVFFYGNFDQYSSLASPQGVTPCRTEWYHVMAISPLPFSLTSWSTQRYASIVLILTFSNRPSPPFPFPFPLLFFDFTEMQYVRCGECDC